MRTRTMLLRAVIATVLATGGAMVISVAPAHAMRMMPIAETCPTCVAG